MEEEYLDPWTSEEGRCGSNGDGGGVAPLAFLRDLDLFSPPAPTRKYSPPRPNPLASKSATNHTNRSPFKNPPQNPHLTPPH